jgi:hypothetical protein
MQILKTDAAKVLSNVSKEIKQTNGKMRVLNLGQTRLVSGGPTIINRPS